MSPNVLTQEKIGFVVIGRNEGDRLKRCLGALKKNYGQSTVVYVDSGSSDDSVSFAKQLGCLIVELDMSKPFTAARARNQGWQHLAQQCETMKYVHFLDGDCVIEEKWPSTAFEYLEQNNEVAVICGQRKELYPEASAYNYFCDIEWNTPTGEAKACGGDALIRLSALRQVNGYDDKVIAGEEPEMCVRLREEGWKIYRYPAIMTYHDAAMTRFSQWWKRTKRCGFAYALGAAMHGAEPEKHWVSEKRRALFWAFILPTPFVMISFLSLRLEPLVALVGIYTLQVLRIYLKTPMENHRFKWAFFSLLGKIPEALGILKYHYVSIKKKQMHIMEYK